MLADNLVVYKHDKPSDLWFNPLLFKAKYDLLLTMVLGVKAHLGIAVCCLSPKLFNRKQELLKDIKGLNAIIML